MAQQTNTYTYQGALKFAVDLKTTATGKAFLPVTIEQDSSAISAAMFEEVAVSFSSMVQQGSQVMIRGYQNQRKDSKSGWWHNSAIVTAFSVDNGNTWVDQKSLRQQQFQQQGQNPQVAHLQECQAQFQQPPVQQAQPQQQAPQQAQSQAEQQPQAQSQPQTQTQTQPKHTQHLSLIHISEPTRPY